MGPRFVTYRWFWAMALLMLIGGGCGAKPYSVVVRLDEQSWIRAFGDTIPSLEVDLVGVNESEKPTWESYPVSSYFSPNDPVRRDADRKTFTFTSSDRNDKTLESKDPIWKKQWVGQQGKGAKWLFVIANLPGSDAAARGSQDPRLLVLPLQRDKWPWRTKVIEIDVQSSMIRCKTPLKSQN